MKVTVLSNFSVIPLIYFLMPNKIEANKPPFKISSSEFILPFLKALPKARPNVDAS